MNPRFLLFLVACFLLACEETNVSPIDPIMGAAEPIAQSQLPTLPIPPEWYNLGSTSLVFDPTYDVSFSIDNKGYVLKSNTNEFWEFDPSIGTWIQRAAFPGKSNRLDGVATSIGRRGYYGLGIAIENFSELVPQQDWWEYNPDADKWIQKRSIKIGYRGYDGAFSASGKAFVITNRAASELEELVNDLWAYDPTLDSWMKKRSFEGLKRENGAVFGTMDKGYYGNGSATLPGIKIDLNDFWEYNPTTNDWVRKANFPGSSVDRTLGLSAPGKGYVALGYDSKELWRFDPVFNLWVKRTSWPGYSSSPSKTTDLLSFSIHNILYIVENDFNWDTNEPMRDMWKYTGN